MNQISQMFNMGGMDLMYVMGLLGVFVGVCLLATYINYHGGGAHPEAAPDQSADPEQ